MTSFFGIGSVIGSVVFLALVVRISTELVNEEPPLEPGMQKMSFTTPEHTEEQAESMFIPGDLKCDGCKAVAFKVRRLITRCNCTSKCQF